MTATVRSLELADLRRGWGEAYRITWENDHFHATHIASGEALDAQSAAGLRKLLRGHHAATSQGAAQERPAPGW